MSDTVLTLRNLTLHRGSRSIVEGLSFAVPRGQLVALMGASGVGKTTVLRAIAGLDKFAAGEIHLGDLRLAPRGGTSASALRELHKRVGIVFQFHNLFANLTAIHNVWLTLVHVYRMSQADAEARATSLLDTLSVRHRADAYPHELSGGEAQRVAIARALAVDPPLLLMDEPTASLDAGLRVELAHTLKSMVEQGRTLIIATHDVDFARQCAARVITLEGGRSNGE